MKMICVMINNIFNLMKETISQLLIKSIQINHADTFNVSKHLSLLIFEVLCKNNIFSQEWFIDTKQLQMLQNLEPECKFMSCAVNNWSVFVSCLSSVEVTH